MAKGKNAAALFEVINKDRRPGAKASLRTPAWWNKNRPAVPPVSPEARAANGDVPAAGTITNAAERLTLHFSKVTIILAAAGVVIGLMLAYFAGRGAKERPAISAQTSEELRSGPAQPQVMDVRHGETGLVPAPTPTPQASNPQTPVVANPISTPLPADGKRIVGLNYVVIQSYPDQKGAEEARDVLAKAGISTTIERGLRGLNPNWYIVVGTEGFARIKSPEFEAYEEKVQRVSDSFAKKRSFKAFTPMGYKWDKTDK